MRHIDMNEAITANLAVFKECRQLGASTLAELNYLIEKLQGLIQAARTYQQQQHRKYYGIFAGWFDLQRTLRRDLSVQKIQAGLKEESDALFHILNTLTFTPPLDQAFSLFHNMQIVYTDNPEGYERLFSWLSTIVSEQRLLGKNFVVQQWGKQAVLILKDMPFAVEAQRKWPAWFYRTHNACQLFIKTHSMLLARAVAEFHAHKPPLTNTQLEVIDNAMETLLNSSKQFMQNHALSQRGRDFIASFIAPIKAQQNNWLNEKLERLNLILEKLNDELEANYPASFTKLLYRADFKADYSLAIKLYMSIKKEQQHGDAMLLQNFERLFYRLQLNKNYNRRCIYASASHNKHTLLLAIATDLAYLANSNSARAKQQTQALMTIRDLILGTRQLTLSAQPFTELVQCLFPANDLAEVDWFLQRIADLLLDATEKTTEISELFSYHFPARIIEQLIFTSVDRRNAIADSEFSQAPMQLFTVDAASESDAAEVTEKQQAVKRANISSSLSSIV